MPVYNVTFGFSGPDVGWSESHALRANTEVAADLGALAIAVAQKRVTFLGREFVLNRIRIAKYSDNGGTVRQGGKFPIKRTFANPIQTAAQAAEPAAVACIGFATTNANIAPAALANNTTRTFLGAPPDDAVNNGGQVDAGKANLGANFTQWANLLVQNSFGWLGDARLDDRPLAGIIQTDDGLVQLTTGPTTNITFTPVVGQTYPARIRGVNNRRSPLNGQVNVVYTAVNTWVTQEVIGIALFQQGGRIRIYNPIKPFVGYDSIVLQETVGKHQRGRPFGTSRGRAPNRIRG